MNSASNTAGKGWLKSLTEKSLIAISPSFLCTKTTEVIFSFEIEQLQNYLHGTLSWSFVLALNDTFVFNRLNEFSGDCFADMKLVME